LIGTPNLFWIRLNPWDLGDLPRYRVIQYPSSGPMVTLTQMAYKIVRYSGLPFIFREFVQRHKITFILFHDIKADLFEQHLLYLLKNYHIISLQQYLEARKTRQLKLPPKSLVITLDDG
jgi:hypothetical protein